MKLLLLLNARLFVYTELLKELSLGILLFNDLLNELLEVEAILLMKVKRDLIEFANLLELNITRKNINMLIIKINIYIYITIKSSINDNI